MTGPTLLPAASPEIAGYRVSGALAAWVGQQPLVREQAGYLVTLN